MLPPRLGISVHQDTNETVVSLTGEIDISTVPQLTLAVETALAGEVISRLILDLKKVTFCDSQGLGTLVVLNREAARAGTVLILTNVGIFLDRALDVTGLKQAFLIR